MKKSSSFFVLSALLAFIALPVCLGLLHVIPNPSDSINAADLGVYPTQEDVASSREKIDRINLEIHPESDHKDLLIPDSNVTINLSLTSEELTALLELEEGQTLPCSNTQIRLNPDNTIEASGILLIDRIPAFSSALGLTEQKSQQILDYMNLSRDKPFNIKTTVSVNDRQFDMKIVRLKIDKINILSGEIILIQNIISSYIQQELDAMQGTVINSMTVEDSRLKIEMNHKY